MMHIAQIKLGSDLITLYFDKPRIAQKIDTLPLSMIYSLQKYNIDLTVSKSRVTT